MTQLTCSRIGILVVLVNYVFSASHATRTSSFAADAKPSSKTIDAADFARRVIAITDVVLQHEIDPPTRQEMILSGTKALLKKSGRTVPIGIARKISALANTDDMERFLEMHWQAVKEHNSVSAEELQTAMFQGLLDTVPGRPMIIPPREFKVTTQIKSNNYVGIGIQLTMNDREATIRTPLPGGPAFHAGAKADDRILEVDGKNIKGLGLADVVRLLRGDEGTKVSVVVRQPGEVKPRKLTMTRGVVPFQSVLGYQRRTNGDWSFRVRDAEPIAYLSIPVIRVSTVLELRQTSRLLRADGTRAIILDLRFASGDADVRHSAFLADELLNKGKIGCVFNADGTKQEFQASPDSAFKQWPIVVLVNQYTRAEAEFVAAALEDNNRAIIVGQQSAGNGYSRRAVELPDGLGGIMLRTELMTRADGRPLQRPVDESETSVASELLPFDRHPSTDATSGNWGVTPKDGNVVKMSNEQFRKLLAWRNEQQVIGRPSSKQISAPHDPQLERAMEILKTKIARQGEKLD